MNTLPVMDPALALQEANQSDLVRRKLDMDALRQRLGDTASKQEKLRESCEGFEAIFLQKMWEQMRKTVPKEGYLHSKDEEMYQSLFDIELCKKMSSAGGIGLADMLYTQLSQQLEDSGRTTTPGSYRRPLEIAPTTTLLPTPPESAQASAPAVSEENAQDKKLTAADLYTPLVQEEEAPQADVQPKDTSLAGALQELRDEISGPVTPEDPSVVAEWAAARAAATGVDLAADDDAIRAGITATVRTELPAAGQSPPDSAAPGATPGAARPETAPPGAASPAAPEQTAAQTAPAVDPALVSWQGPGPVSAQPKPTQLFGRDKKAPQTNAADAEKKTTVQPRGMAPQETLWPLAAEGSRVTSRFGWEENPATRKREWNSGVRIAASPGAPVRAVLPGTVVYSGPRDGLGNTVVLEHKDGYRSYYSNLEDAHVQVGEKLKHGAEFAKIAAQPSSGADEEKSASLYFELKRGEMALNPESAIRRLTVAGR